MDCSELVLVINPVSTIPKLISRIRHSFRQCEYDEVQNILMEREAKTKLQIEELERARDSLKKETDLLEKTQSFTELEKCSLQEKLETSERRCQELDKEIVQLGANLRLLKRDKLVEVQNLMEREVKTKLQIEELVRDLDSLKKENDLLGKTQRYMELEKCALQEKLGMSEIRCQELDKKIVQMEGDLKILKRDKLDVEEKLDASNCKSEVMDGRLLKMEKEIEELSLEKLVANRTIEELKEKEIESDQSLQDLQHKYVEACQTIDELRAQKMESDKVAEAFGSTGVNLEMRISTLETELANLLSVRVEDLPNMVNGNATTYTDSEEGGNEDDSSAGSGVVGLAPKDPAVAESWDIVQDNEGEEPNFKDVRIHMSRSSNYYGSPSSISLSFHNPTHRRKAQASSSAPRDVIVLSDSDDEPDHVDTTHILDTLSGQASKRNRTECEDDSPTYPTAKKERSTFTPPSHIVDLDDEDAHMNNFVASLIKTKGSSAE